MAGLLKALNRGRGRMLTRFPPEPNGSLHLGHVRAMNINFATAKFYSGECGLRFDDSNPDTAKQECYDNITEIINWLGYKPYKVTKTSNYFLKLLNCASQLINKGSAYVCH